MKSEEAAIRDVLEHWARATREGRHDEVLANHLDDLVIFDVLPPLLRTGLILTTKRNGTLAACKPTALRERQC